MPSRGPGGQRWPAAAALGLIIAASAAMIPRNYMLPKQDYTGARDYVEQRLGPDETAVAIGLAGDVFEIYYAPQWQCATTGRELEAAISRHRRVWLVYTMPIHVRAYRPDIWEVVQREFGPAKVFPGTLAGGEVFVCKTRPDGSARSATPDRARDRQHTGPDRLTRNTLEEEACQPHDN